jgi:hypothetical protein
LSSELCTQPNQARADARWFRSLQVRAIRDPPADRGALEGRDLRLVEERGETD